MKELPPVSSFQRIGFEIEGVGYVRMNWGEHKPDTEHVDFKEVFKKTKLLRSLSYNDFRGVYLSPEVAQDNIGYHHPAELISSPHRLSSQGLENLRHSYQKAMTSKDSTINHLLKAQDAYLFDARYDTHEGLNRQNYTVSTRWSPAYAKAGRNLQTTVGIEVAMLLSDNLHTRNRVAEMLIYDGRKREKITDLLKASICIQRVLTQSKYSLFDDDAASEYYMRIRLSIFMYLLEAYMLIVYQGRQLGYDKDVYGANFKGYSSFQGCGVPCSMSFSERLKDNARLRNFILEGILSRIREFDIPQWIRSGFTEPHNVFNLCCIGEERLSTITSIPNFYHNGKLYTVVECREGDAPLNQLMGSFLTSAITTDNFIATLRENYIYRG